MQCTIQSRLQARRCPRAASRTHHRTMSVVLLTLTLLAVFAGLLAAGPADAQEPREGRGPIRFDIPAGSLESALVAFSNVSGVTVSFTPDVVQGLESSGLSGSYSPPQALDRLLAGSGLIARFSGAGTVTLAQAGPQDGDGPMQLGPVTVTASRFETPVSLFPKSVTVLEAESIEEQPSFDHNLNAGLSKTVPGVSFADSGGNTPRIRGRNASVRINGVEVNDTIFSFSTPQQSIASSSLERVEVVRGSDATFGFGASGGAINYITRRPTPGPMQVEAYAELDFQDEDIEESFGQRAGFSATGSKGAFEYALGADARFANTLFDPDVNPLPDGFRLG